MRTKLKHSIINLNWVIKLKATKTFTKKKTRIKIKNPKDKDYIEKYNI